MSVELADGSQPPESQLLVSSSQPSSLTDPAQLGGPWKEKNLNVFRHGKKICVTNLNLAPSKKTQVPTHTLPCALGQLPIVDLATHVVCNVPVTQSEGSSNTGKFTTVSFNALFSAYQARILSFAKLRLRDTDPCRPYAIVDKYLPGRVHEMLHDLRHFSSIFNDDPVIIEWQRFEDIPYEHANAKAVLIWPTHHFASHAHFVDYMRRYQYAKDWFLSFNRIIPIPASVDRVFLTGCRGLMLLEETEATEVGWWPTHDPETLEEFRLFFPSYIPPTSKLFTVEGVSPSRGLVHLDDVVEEQGENAPEIGIVKTLLDEMRKYDQHFRVSGPLRRVGDKMQCDLTAGGQPFKCHQNFSHVNAGAKILLQWDTEGLATASCMDLQPGGRACSVLHIGGSPDADRLLRWKKTFAFWVKHKMVRADLPITESHWGYYRRAQIKEFFRAIDPEWDFESNFGYHPEPTDQRAWSMDLYRELLGPENQAQDPLKALDYLSLFLCVVKAKTIVVRTSTSYIETSISSAKDVVTSCLTYNMRTTTKKLKDDLILPIWFKNRHNGGYESTGNLPLDLDRLLPASVRNNLFRAVGDHCNEPFCNWLNTLVPSKLLSLDQRVRDYEGYPEREFVAWYVDAMLSFWTGGEKHADVAKACRDLLSQLVQRLICQFGTAQYMLTVLHGEGGSGKGSFFDILKKILGASNVTNPMHLDEFIRKKFNDEMNVPLVCADECDVTDSKQREQVDNNVKRWTTQTIKDAEAKFGSGKISQYPITTAIAMSNNADLAYIPGVLPGDNRRILIIASLPKSKQDAWLGKYGYQCQCREQPCNVHRERVKTSELFWANLHYCLKIPAFVNALIGYFVMCYDQTSDFDKTSLLGHRIPTTDMYVAQIALRCTPTHNYLRRLIDQKTGILSLLSDKHKSSIAIECRATDDPNDSSRELLMSVDTHYHLFKSLGFSLSKKDFVDGMRADLRRAPFCAGEVDDKNATGLKLAKKLVRYVWTAPDGAAQDRAVARTWRLDGQGEFVNDAFRLPSKARVPMPRTPSFQVQDDRSNQRSFMQLSSRGGFEPTPSSSNSQNNSEPNLRAVRMLSDILAESNARGGYDDENDDGDGEPDNGEDVNGKRAREESEEERRRPNEYDSNDSMINDDDEEDDLEDDFINDDLPSKKKSKKRLIRREDVNSSPSKSPKGKEEADGDDGLE